jgi:hypothetical protein
MLFSLAKTAIGLLTLSQALDTVYAFPNQDFIRPEHGVAGEKDYFESTLEKRTTPPPQPELINWGQESGGTWKGLVEERPGSNWNIDTCRNIVHAAWKRTQSGTNPPPILVAGLYVPGEGVFMGSIPHGKDAQSISAQANLDGRARTQAPIFWSKVKDREFGPGTTKWHAEDMAILMYESERRPSGTTYPSGSQMFIWGQYFTGDRIGPKAPCRRDRPTQHENNAWISPSCSDVMQKLGISFPCW